MISTVIACVTVVLLAALSFGANQRFAGRTRLPMQFNLAGTATWSAPRPVALAFTPVLAALVFGVALALGLGHNPQGTAAASLIAISFLAVHALHLTLIARHRA